MNTDKKTAQQHPVGTDLRAVRQGNAQQIPVGTDLRAVRLSVVATALRCRVPRSSISYLQTPKRRAAAFTLIELLVVITVIGILAGLTLAAMGGIQKRGARAKAESDIQALSSAIEEFHRDFGKYPAANSNELFKELTGSNAAINSVPGKIKVYFEPTPGIIGTNSNQNFFQDPWGTGYFYITDGPNLRNRGLFDVYSTAGTADQKKWIRN